MHESSNVDYYRRKKLYVQSCQCDIGASKISSAVKGLISHYQRGKTVSCDNINNKHAKDLDLKPSNMAA